MAVTKAGFLALLGDAYRRRHLVAPMTFRDRCSGPRSTDMRGGPRHGYAPRAPPDAPAWACAHCRGESDSARKRAVGRDRGLRCSGYRRAQRGMMTSRPACWRSSAAARKPWESIPKPASCGLVVPEPWRSDLAPSSSASPRNTDAARAQRERNPGFLIARTISDSRRTDYRRGAERNAPGGADSNLHVTVKAANSSV